MTTSGRLVLAVAFGAMGGCYPVFAGDEPTAWETDYARVRETAAAKNRPVLLSIGSASCGWCTKMHATTFRDRDVTAVLEREFVTGKIDAGRYPDLVRALGVRAYPTTVIAAPDGKILRVVEGFKTAEETARLLREAQAALREHRAQLILTGGTKPK